jgi:hypothetical protein
VHVPEVLESALGVDDGEVNVEISVGLLSRFDHVHQFLHAALELGLVRTLMSL